jgi:hypothetical protein
MLLNPCKGKTGEVLERRRAVSVVLALAVALVLVAPLALATCHHCNYGGASTACVTTDYPTSASGLVSSTWMGLWLACFQGHWDSYSTYVYCYLYEYRGEVIWTFTPPQPPRYGIGMTAEAWLYLWLYEFLVLDAFIYLYEDCYGYCLV